jgi:transposase, IS5 family
VIGCLQRQASLFGFAFFKEVARLEHPTLSQIDALLDEEKLVAICAQRLAERRPRSRDFGRTSIAPDRLLRCVVLKHLKGWSFRELEEELRANLLYRRFTRFYEDPIPDHSVFCRLFALFGKEATEALHAQVVARARELCLASGHVLRTDTTAVETNIHHPSDSSLLADSIRVLTRALKAISQGCPEAALQVVDHARAAKYRVLEIARAARVLHEGGRQRMHSSYGKLLRLTRTVAGQAKRVLAKLSSGELKPRRQAQGRVQRQQESLGQYLPLIERVMAQTQARIFDGQKHYPDKLLSLFEPHTVVIRKGKAHKPNEFGRLVRIDEVENGVVSAYEVATGNLADQQQWVRALEQHVACFGAAPHLAAADRGYWSAHNERVAAQMGVQQVVLPARGPLNAERTARQKERWFRRGQAWRAGIEPRIATLKHRFGMDRALYKSEPGFARYVGFCVIAHNLVAMSRAGPGG